MRHALLLLLICVPTATLAAQQYGYRVTDQKPQSTDNYVQGLEIDGGFLYVSTGLYGKSQLRRYRFEDGSLETARKLNPRIFAEGLTVLGDKVYQLTLHNRMMLVYGRDDLQALEWFPIPGEGWGLTHNNSELVYSDGSDKLHFLSPQTRKITRSLSVTENGKPLSMLNELEWIEGRIWANVWLTDRIVVIDPDSGEVTASIDLHGLRPAAARRNRNAVLNGIARNPADGSIWITGKHWPSLFQIEVRLPEEAK